MIFNLLLFFLFLAQLESIFNFHRIQKDFNFWELLNIICGKTSLKGSFSLQSKNVLGLESGNVWNMFSNYRCFLKSYCSQEKISQTPLYQTVIIQNLLLKHHTLCWWFHVPTMFKKVFLPCTVTLTAWFPWMWFISSSIFRIACFLVHSRNVHL